MDNNRRHLFNSKYCANSYSISPQFSKKFLIPLLHNVCYKPFSSSPHSHPFWSKGLVKINQQFKANQTWPDKARHCWLTLNQCISVDCWAPICLSDLILLKLILAQILNPKWTRNLGFYPPYWSLFMETNWLKFTNWPFNFQCYSYFCLQFFAYYITSYT